MAVTGVGGPQSQEDKPPGTVYFGLVAGDLTGTEHRFFGGEPQDVIEATTLHALVLLHAALARRRR